MALTDNILAYWNLNDDGSGGVSLVDSTGNGYTLTNNNEVTLGTGIIDGCAVLNGSDYLSSLNIPITSSTFSYSGWIYPTDLSYDRIIFSGDSVGDLMIGIVTGGGTTTPYLGVGRNAVAWDYLSNAQIVVNQWQYVTVTDDGTSVSLYINGNYVGGGASSSYAITATASLGYQYNSAFNVNFFGSLDETGLWNRALSPTEISNLFYGGDGNTYPFTNPLPVPLTVGCKAYWNLNNDGSGGVSLLDSTGNGNTLTNNGGISLGTGIIGGDAVGNGSGWLSTNSPIDFSNDFTVNFWVDGKAYGIQNFAGQGGVGLAIDWEPTSTGRGLYLALSEVAILLSYPAEDLTGWQMATVTRSGDLVSFYVNGSFATSSNGITNNFTSNYGILAGNTGFSAGPNNGIGMDEVGIWSRALSPTEVSNLYNGGAGLTYPFTILYYNNAQEDGDWGNLLNWWQDSAFTTQATALPTSTNPVNLYNQVTQNTQGADQCFCASASFWSADFGAGLTLQSTGVVNMQGTSVMAGTTTDSVSMHDSSQLSNTSVIDGNVVMRDSSRAFGSILGNATVYYDTGNGQYPIGGTVGGSVTYLGWPALSPQWFNDQVTGGADDGDFSNLANWWANNTYTTRPLNSVGTQALPDASTDVFIAPNTGIVANTGTANPTINSVTANNSNIQNISITATNGFLFSGNQGVENAVLYGNVVFQDTAYNDHAVIQGKATYKSAASLQYSWGQNSLGNVNAGMYNGSTAFEVNIPTGNSNKGFLSALLGFPWYIRF